MKKIRKINKFSKVIFCNKEKLINGKRKKRKKRKTKNKPVIVSTKGYCQESLYLQEEHLPFNRKKLIIGINSHQTNLLRQ